MRSVFDEFFDSLLFDGLWPEFNPMRRRALEAKKEEVEKETPKGETDPVVKEVTVPSTNYLQTDWPSIYTMPFFELKDGKYVHTSSVGENTKPEDIDINIYEDSISLYYSSGSLEEGNASSCSLSSSGIPKDLDRDTLKAVVKNGILTITADKKELPEEEKPIPFKQEKDKEYDVKINF